MTESKVNECPQCSNAAIFLASGTIICKHCGYSNVKEKQKEKQKETFETVEISKNKDYTDFSKFVSSLKITNAKVFFVVGFLVMFYGLGMNTTYDRTHNIGLLNTRSNVVNIGGFLMLSGAILGVKEAIENKEKDE